METILPSAISILSEVSNGKSIRVALRSAIDSHSLKREEESALYYLVFEIIRRLNVIDLYIKTSSASFSLKKISSSNRSLLRIATHLLKMENKSSDFVYDSLSSFYEKILHFNFNEILNLIQDVSDDCLYENRYDLASNLSIEFFTPTWVIRKFLKQWNDDFVKKLLFSFLQDLPLYVRINPFKANLEEITHVLDSTNISYSVSEGINNLIKIKGSEIPIPRLQEFKSGKIVIQQKASVLVSLILDPKIGENILDMCAAPGGKTSHIAAILGDGKNIDAVDLSKERVQILKNRLELLGIKSVNIIQTDARKLHEIKQTKYDKILLDPPCSGSGTYSSRPENKWRMNQRDLRWYINLQRDLFDVAGNLLKPGGFIIYSTCSLFHEENHDIVSSFLEKTPEFQLVEASPMIGQPSSIMNNMTQELYPHLHETEGFFIAKIKKEE